MHEEIQMQVLAQGANNIQKLFDLATRIDERVKMLQEQQTEFTEQLAAVRDVHSERMQRIAVLESKDIDGLASQLTELEIRLTAVESSSNRSQDRWNKAMAFIIQLAWVVLAAWLLMKLNLQAPSVP